ncbi:phosphotransferase [Actinomadura monticuli]|uniref:Phosphotransferase n=1 Tax=Actinomadura monticuli TaxID=3097367 RepID=A0ABV4Q547_9ACTN
MTAELARRGIAVSGPPREIRRWSLSAVLRIPTGSGPLWYKEVPPLFAHEGRVTGWVSQVAPGSVPEVVGHGPGWQLTTEAPRPRRSSGGSPLDAIVPVQVASAGRAGELLAMGCPDRRPAGLPGAVAALSARADLLAVDERTALRRVVPVLERISRRLDGLDIPATLVHGDVSTSNAWRTDRGWVYIDWTDACVSHPFVELAQPLLDARSKARRRRIEASFARMWERHGPEKHVAVAMAAAPVIGAAYQAETYRRIIDAVGMVDGHPELLREWVRRLCEAAPGWI